MFSRAAESFRLTVRWPKNYKITRRVDRQAREYYPLNKVNAAVYGLACNGREITMEKKIKIIGFAGSLRKESYNRALLRAAQELAPDNVELEIFDLEGLPLFNQDLENDPHPKVADFKSRIRAADAILIATPEYNYSIPGVLKNAIDCASRPYGDNAFAGKPVAIMGASIGMTGTARAQYHLRQSFVFLDVYPLNSPEVMVSYAGEKNFPGGRLADQKSRDMIKQLLVNLAEWTMKLKGGKELKKAA